MRPGVVRAEIVSEFLEANNLAIRGGALHKSEAVLSLFLVLRGSGDGAFCIKFDIYVL